MIHETIFSLPTPSFPLPLSLEIAGITHSNPNYRIFRERSPIYVLEYVVSGRGFLNIGGTSYTAKGGDAYLLQPGQRQEYWSDSREPWEKIWFNVSGPLIDALVSAYELKDSVIFPDCPLEYEFRSALAIVRDRASDAYMELGISLHRIIAKIAEFRKSRTGHEKSADGVRLKEYLDRNWMRNVSLDELAELIGRSRSQTIRIFRKNWNLTPVQYLQKQKLHFACQSLMNTDCKLLEIADSIGFTDEFYFSNWFKQRIGLSPLNYRRKLKNDAGTAAVPTEHAELD